MEHAIQTGFKYSRGRPVHVGDILQHRLGKYSSSGGPVNLRVIQFGKKFHLVAESNAKCDHGGLVMTEKLCDRVVTLLRDQMPGQ